MKEIACETGAFGKVRIMERIADGARLYCIGDNVQTMITHDGVSLFGYIHAIKLLLGGAKDVLMLGGGGGSLATMLARRGVDVTVVDIDPVAENFARRYFGLDSRVRWITQDAETFLKAATGRFDGLAIDTCDEHGAIEQFATPTSLVESLRLLRPEGSIVLNLSDNRESIAYAWQLAGAAAENGYDATLYRPEFGSERNELLHIQASGARSRVTFGDISQRPAEVRFYLMMLDRFIRGSSKKSGAPYWRAG